MKYNSILITGGLGFIGSNFVNMLEESDYQHIIILDKFTYAANIENLKTEHIYTIIKGDIGDLELVKQILNQYQIDLIVNFAAESHVDNSIASPCDFINTNILGCYNLLRAALEHYHNTDKLLLVHVSTDEVFGSLPATGQFNENYPYQPNSPYSASKAASDHLVRAWYHTYQLPTIITNCSNNYGPHQYHEKLIPKAICNSIAKQKIPVYGNGENIRDWIHVEDHCQGIMQAIQYGNIGESYCFGGDCELSSLEVVKLICEIFTEKFADFDYYSLIEFVEDRKGHDFRYSINSTKAKTELGFNQLHKDFRKSLIESIDWYLKHHTRFTC